MTFIYFLELYLLATILFFAVDMLWLGYLAKDFYAKSLGSLLSHKVNWTAAIIFYLIYIVGILIFAVIPALQAGSFGYAVLWGALFGFFTYATYDLTNLATLKIWPLTFAVVDIIWGVVLCTLVASLTYLIGTWMHAA